MPRERVTYQAMLDLYCHDNHGTQTALCDDCSNLLAYAMQRLDKCPYQEGKTTCANCPIHCYQEEKRERTREVMRYAGPRMLLKHPYLALAHLVDGFRKTPLQQNRR